MAEISLLICTRNGASTIADAIACAGRQVDVEDGSYEVIVVDNGSTDDTVVRARDALATLRCHTLLLHEPREGKMNAFMRGIAAASAPLISIVDDDNQICDEFICRTVAMFQEFPQLGIVGSVNTLLSREDAPSWFQYAADRFACGTPCLEGLVVRPDTYRTIASRGAIAGAGSTFRKAPLESALAKGFSFMNETLRGGKMITGEDTELSYLFHHFGFQFGSDTRITLRHDIHPSRLSWPYARRMFRSCGTGALAVDAFLLLEDEANGARFTALRATWWWMVARRVRRLANLLPSVARAKAAGKVIDPVWLQWDEQVGALDRILGERGRYTRRMKAMLGSEWRKLRPLSGMTLPRASGPGTPAVPAGT